MTKETEQIEKGFKKLFAKSSTSFIAKVISDKIDTVDVEDLNGTKYLDVRKTATQGKKGVLFKLVENSFVIVSRISESDELCVIMMSEIEGIYIKVGDTSVEVSTNLISFNGGKNEGIVKANELKIQLEKLSNRVDAIVNVLSTGANGGGTVTFADMSLPNYINAMADKENFTNIKNDKIKH